MNPATKRKRAELTRFIQQVVIPETAVRGVVAIGSVAKGTAREDSDIDAVVFLQPLDLYAVPAECKWQPDQGRFHGIFSAVENAVQLDFKRLDLAQWSDPAFAWPEPLCAELLEGWVAFDRNGGIQELIAARTTFGDELRQARLDEAIARLDWLLAEGTTDRAWATLGSTEAHYRLHVAFDHLVRALLAYNRRWRTFPSRELADLLQLTWLPEEFEQRLPAATNALSMTKESYQERASLLRQFFNELVVRCRQEGLYGANPVSEAFMRQYEEPGRDWNMDAWEKAHNERKKWKSKA